MNIFAKKYISLSLPMKATLWFTFSNFLIKGINFVSVPIFTRLLIPSEYGMLSVFASYEQIILILATWEMQMGAYQKGLFKYKEDITGFTNATLALINILTIVVFSIIFLFFKPFSTFTQFSKNLTLLLFLYMFFQPAYYAWVVRKRTEYNYKAVVFATIGYCLINVLLPLAALFILPKTATTKFSFNLIGSICFCLFFYVSIVRPQEIVAHRSQTKDYWKYLIGFSAPLAVHSLSYFFLSQSDRVMISKLCDNTQTAYYSVAYSVASAVNILQNSINQSLLPWRYEMIEKRKYDKIRDVTNKLLLLIGGFITAFIMIAPEFMRLFFQRNYYEAIWCIPPVSISVYFMFLYSVFVSIETYYENTKYIMYVSVACSLLNVFLNYAFIKVFGYIACAYTSLFSYMLFAVGHFVFMRKVVNGVTNLQELFDIKFIVLFSLLITVLSFFITYLYRFIWLRYSIVLVFALVAAVKRNEIIKITRVLKER